ncbi:MAG: secondary thiamine-phosphate synthase enzyme YjbQ [Oscillospiraceae bacterium]|nr:secondary thiamine-phosphate synthase enzyme YjbQ [Oscillospiraceae bacterium]
MKSFRKELMIQLPSRRGLVNITGKVDQALKQSGIREGLILVNAMDPTSSIFVSDDESGLHQDFETWLEQLAPEKPYEQYCHNGRCNNADAYLKRQLMGREAVIAITDGYLDLQRWEQIFYFEFDGMKEKHVLIKVIGE